ncbi:MAG TPA: dipeptidyl aminopeptidase [Candidatus Latescibacteria bacterium]|nr:dipeptidyl aminopeptidase [Candidatus Latescibacterota bacterium]
MVSALAGRPTAARKACIARGSVRAAITFMGGLIMMSKLFSGHHLQRLFEKPDYQPASGFSAAGLEAVYIENEPYRGNRTTVFAWMGLPELKPGEQCPAMVLLHGGGGTAFDEWVRLWNARGYAAIVIDQCGCQPQIPVVDGEPHDRNPDGGPPGWDQSVFQITDPLTDQWQYHAITAAIRAHSLLAHHPDVDAQRIGVTGISWGGYMTCLVAGVDERLKCAVPVYGCGFLGENSGWKYGLFPTRPEADIKKWLEHWDPAVFLPHARMPFLWVNGTNDFAYPMDSMQKSYDIQGGPHQLCLRIEMPHGHPPGWEPVEIMDFADHLLRGKLPLIEITEFGHDTDSMWAHYESPDPIKEAVVCYTRAEGCWADRNYNELPAAIDHENRRVTAAIPNLARVCYLNLIDQKDRVISARHICPDYSV